MHISLLPLPLCHSQPHPDRSRNILRCPRRQLLYPPAGGGIRLSNLRGHILQRVPHIRCNLLGSSLLAGVESGEGSAKANLVNFGVEVDGRRLLNDGLGLDVLEDSGEDRGCLDPHGGIGDDHALGGGDEVGETGDDDLDVGGLLELLGEGEDDVFYELTEETVRTLVGVREGVRQREHTQRRSYR